MQEFTGLNKLRTPGAHKVYCPKCGNYLEAVPNGWFHGQMFYCPKEKKVFAVQLRDITKKAGEEYVNQCIQSAAVEEVRNRICKENYKEVLEVLENEE